MENVNIPVSGEKYVWVKNTDASNGKVVLRKSTLLSVVIPMVIDVGVEEHIKSLPNSSDMFLTPESVEAWGYDIREYSAYSVDDVDNDTGKYVWYTSGITRYVLAKQGHYGISIVTLDNSVDASTLVGNPLYMLSEEEVENSVFDPDKFTTVGKNGVRGPKGKVESHKVNYTRYRLSDKFKEARAKGMVYIPVKTEEEASILRAVINTDNGYEDGFDGMLLVYSTRDARFRPLYKYANAKEMSVEEVVELSPTTFSTDGDASDVISAPYVTANGTALDLSDTPIGTDSLPSSGITSTKIMVGYRLTDKFKEALRKGTVLIPVEDAIEAAILGTVFEIDPGYKYNEGYSTLGVSALIVSKWLPAMFGPYLNLPGMEEIAFGDAVEGDSTTPYTSF